MPGSRWGTKQLDAHIFRVAHRYVFAVKDSRDRLIDVIELPLSSRPADLGAALQQCHDGSSSGWVDDYAPLLARVRKRPYFAHICETSGPQLGRLRLHGCYVPRLRVRGDPLSLTVVRDRMLLVRDECPTEATDRRLGTAIARAFRQAEHLPPTRFPWHSGVHATGLSSMDPGKSWGRSAMSVADPAIRHAFS